MVRDAERNAQEDKKKKELIETRNSADSMVYSTDKSLSEHRAKLSKDVIDTVEAEVKTLRSMLESEQDPAKLKAQVDKVGQASLKIGEAIYKTGSTTSGQSGPGAGAGPGASGETVDAEFKEEKKK